MKLSKQQFLYPEEKLNLIPWVNWNTIPIIANNDGDGICSTLFLLNHKLTRDKAVVKGLYTLNKLYLIDKKDIDSIKDMVGIDLEMQIKGMHCLGHHMNITCNPQSVNANDLFGTSENLLENYQRKCPLNTLILLYWLFNEKPKNDREIAFLVYWDSVIYNYEMYKSNVVQWLTKLGMTEILDALENRNNKIKDIINREILPVTSYFKTGYEKSNLPQCNIWPIYDSYTKSFYLPEEPKEKSITSILQLAKDIMGWDIIDFPTVYTYKENYAYSTVLIDEDFQNFKEKIIPIQDKFISSAVTTKQKFCITTKEPIDEEAKKYGLIISNSGVYRRKNYKKENLKERFK